jgi:CP family cyanate transporter-like MFS transporter
MDSRSSSASRNDGRSFCRRRRSGKLAGTRARPVPAEAPRIKRAVINPRLIPLLLLWLSGACLRLTVLAIPPVVPLLHADLHLSETQIGWLSSLPSMLFAIAAVPASLLIARVGLIRALLVGLLLTALGGAARGAMADVTFLFASTTVMAAGVAIMQPTLPPLVRIWFPKAVGFATAVYTTGLLIGEILPVSLTIALVLPLVHDSWRLSFVVWASPVLLTAVIVAAYAKRRNGADGTAPAANALWWPDWRRPLIWQLGLIFGSVNTIYFVSNAFLPDYVIAQGRPDLVGAALTALNVGQLPAAFLLLGLAGPLVTRPWAYAATGLASLAALIGMVTSHGMGIVVFAGLLGFTNALTLTLALALPSMLSAPDDVHRTSAGMFTISYSCAMLLSIVGGWLWDLTNMPVASFAPVALCAIVIVVLASTVKNARQ